MDAISQKTAGYMYLTVKCLSNSLSQHHLNWVYRQVEVILKVRTSLYATYRADSTHFNYLGIGAICSVVIDVQALPLAK